MNRNEKRRVERAHMKWRDILALRLWKATVRYHDDYREDNDSKSPWATMMDTTIEWPYRRYQINVYGPTIEKADNGEIDDLMRHELIHVLLEPIAERMPRTRDGMNLVEHVTTSFEIALGNAFDAKP